MLIFIGSVLYIRLISTLPIFLYTKPITTNSKYTRLMIYKNPLYNMKRIQIKIEPYMLFQSHQPNIFTIIVDIDKATLSLLPNAQLRLLDVNSNKIISKYTIPSGNTPATQAVSNDLLQKMTDNYPYQDLFPYQSESMMVNYDKTPKTLIITLKTNIQPDDSLTELNSYLQSKNISLEELNRLGVTYTYYDSSTINSTPSAGRMD